MINLAMMKQVKTYVDRKNNIWMTLGLTGFGETELPEVHIGDVAQNVRQKHAKAARTLAEIYGY